MQQIQMSAMIIGLMFISGKSVYTFLSQVFQFEMFFGNCEMGNE